MTRTIYILLIFSMLSCTSRTIYKKPNDLIPKNQMVDLWTDILIAEGARNVKNKKLERKINYLPLVYEKYKIDSARFMRSSIYYTSRIEVYDEIFQKVKENLITLKNTYDPDMADVDKNAPVSKQDSIKNARKNKRAAETKTLLQEKSLPIQE